MTKIKTLIVLVLLTGCTPQNAVVKQTITPEIIQNIDTTSEQALLYGHYENVRTVYGGSYKGCCVLNEDRIKLAQFVMNLFEEKTGEEFGDRNMLIGSDAVSIIIDIEPSDRMKSLNPKRYYVKINKSTALVETFVERKVGPN